MRDERALANDANDVDRSIGDLGASSNGLQIRIILRTSDPHATPMLRRISVGCTYVP